MTKKLRPKSNSIFYESDVRCDYAIRDNGYVCRVTGKYYKRIGDMSCNAEMKNQCASKISAAMFSRITFGHRAPRDEVREKTGEM